MCAVSGSMCPSRAACACPAGAALRWLSLSLCQSLALPIPRVARQRGTSPVSSIRPQAPCCCKMVDDGVTEALAASSLADPLAASDEAPPAAGEQVVTPWDVQGGAGGIDYDKLLSTFGCQPINADLIARCVWLGARALQGCLC